MPWFRVDDNLAFHRKVVSAGNPAMGLWVRAGSWSAFHLTDGFVPEHMVTVLGTPAQRARLVKAGLWSEVDGGCQFHEWMGRQPTSTDVLAARAKNADRQAAHRARREEERSLASTTSLQYGRTADGTIEPGFDQSSGNPQVDEPRNGVTHTLVTPLVTGVSHDPDPTRPNTPANAGVPAQPKQRRATRIPDDFTVTPAMVGWVRDRCPNVDGKLETERFSNYWAAKAGRDAVKVDWERTWRNWMLEEQKRAGNRRPNHLRGLPGYDADGNQLRDPKSGALMER